MNYQALSPNYAVAPQIQPEDVAQIRADGFQVIICNRPDGEAEEQPAADSIRKASEDAGLEFHYCPMNGPNVAQEDVAKLKELLEADKRIFAFCRTGNRSGIFYQQATE